MDNKFKLRISRIFHSSCKSRDDVAVYHDVLDKSPFLSRSRSPSPSVVVPPPPRPPLPRPSICRPRTPPSLHVNNSCIISSGDVRGFVPSTKPKPKPKPRPRITRFSHFAYNPFYDRGGSRNSAVKDDRGQKKKKKRGPKAMLIADHRDFYSSDDEREEEEDDDERTVDTLFSSRSLSSSESSEKRRRMRRRRGSSALVDDVGGVRGSVAVVKKSRDPYGDFRTSMVEMIIERQIFGEKELHQLLLCFLSLNPTHHHNIIFQVFKEIRDALFCM